MLVLGNRGKCAQPCRLPYQLLKDSDVIDKGHLLSPKDLCSLDLLPTLVNLGITCFKIEGRLKNPEYVSTVTRIYRKYIDLALSDKPYVIDEKDRKDLLQVFNRGGFSKGYLDGKPNQEFIYKQKPNNMGLFLGTVHNFNSNKGYITLKLEEDISIGDSVSLEKEKGLYTISELMINNKNVPNAKKGDIVKIGRIKGQRISINDRIFKMSSKDLSSIANEYVNIEKVKQIINCKIIVHKNSPVSMQIYTDNKEFDNIYNNINFTITSDLVPVDSINSPITAERIIDQINKLGGTPFVFGKIDIDLDDNLYVPSISKLNQLRRDCISKLEELLIEKIHRVSNINYQQSCLTASVKDNNQKEICILLNKLNLQDDYSKLTNINIIYIPLKYFFMSDFSSKILELTNNNNCYIFMPSVLKDSVMKIVNTKLPEILAHNRIQGFVVSNISQLYMLQQYSNKYKFIANYTLNIYNNSTINELKQLGVSCVTLSPELDKDSLNTFNTDIETETIIYGNLPVMTTNYCLLSGSNYCLEKCNSNCNNTSTEYYLKDRMDMNFRVIPDSFSKTTTIYNSKKLSLGISEVNSSCVRFSFIDENVDKIRDIIETFKDGKILEGKDFTNGNFKRFV